MHLNLSYNSIHYLENINSLASFKFMDIYSNTLFINCNDRITPKLERSYRSDYAMIFEKR